MSFFGKLVRSFLTFGVTSTVRFVVCGLNNIACWLVLIIGAPMIVDGAGDEPFTNAVAAVSPTESKKREATTASVLKKYIVHLSDKIGERNLGRYKKLCDAAMFIESELKSFGYKPRRHEFRVKELDCFNIEVALTGTKRPDEIVIIGAHYDSAEGTPGANDNGSGTAALLVLAQKFAKKRCIRTLRFVAWTNEEPPYFQNSGEMGSWVYAERCRKADEKIVAVVSLETMGYFSDQEDSQNYPALLASRYPTTGNFIGLVSNPESKPLLEKVYSSFKKHSKVPCEKGAFPAALPGVGWSDHWSFWQEGYQGIMVTDTAPYRYPHYHQSSDTDDKINFEVFSKVVDGLEFVVEDLVKIP